MGKFKTKWNKNLHAKWYGLESIPENLSAYDSIIEIAKNAINRDGFIVDIGAGCGYVVNTLKSLNYKAEGLTISRADAAAHGLTLCDMHDLPYKDSSVDVVIAQHVIEHALSPKLLLTEIFRVLRVDGLLLVDTPVTPGGIEGINRAHFYTFSADQYLDMLKKNGFLITKAEYIRDYFRIQAYKEDK
jgi:ubiquinone/menaquinone biosynthesis C-methylase UbiE